VAYIDALPLVQIDLNRVRENVREIRARCGVDVIAVVKADGYGLGMIQVARALRDLVSAFYVFRPSEAIEANLSGQTNRPVLCAMPDGHSAEELRGHNVRPGVWTVEMASQYRSCDPILAVDTGQQRFAAPPEQIDAIIAAGGVKEAFTHASTPQQTDLFAKLTAGRELRRHAAGTSLLDTPAALFDAVRPGLAMYRGAVRVSARLIDARTGNGPAGYSGFQAPRHGVIIGGYSNGLSPGTCLINGVRRRILEVGMQSSFVELGANDKIGNEVVLLGDGLTEQEIGNAWRCSPQEAMFRLARCGRRAIVHS
jgi:alanine racemase